jgi:hypothetical protein
MSTEIYSEEYHPWLKFFCIMAIPYGLIILLPGCALVSEEPLWVLGIIGCVILIISSIYTLKKTDFFRHWSKGIQLRDKLISFIPIYFGVCTFIALLIFVPFMGFINRIGEDMVSGIFGK